jgi:hypothetical protein
MSWCAGLQVQEHPWFNVDLPPDCMALNARLMAMQVCLDIMVTSALKACVDCRSILCFSTCILARKLS